MRPHQEHTLPGFDGAALFYRHWRAPSHRGEAWVPRRRSQQEMDDLVRAAGFRKLEMRIDAWGIFTVSLAQRGEG